MSGSSQVIYNHVMYHSVTLLLSLLEDSPSASNQYHHRLFGVKMNEQNSNGGLYFFVFN